MSRATLFSRVVFGLLVLSTFTAFFVAQRLKRTEPLVYAVQMKKYVSPNGDGLREKARLRFRTKKTDVVTVEVLNRAGEVVRPLAIRRHLKAGPHTFLWNGRTGVSHKSPPAPDGAYRVRISLGHTGRTFIPDKFFVVDTTAPKLTAAVEGTHTVSALRARPAGVTVKFSGISDTRRIQFDVYAVRGQRTAARPVAAFVSVKNKSDGIWNLTVGQFRSRKTRCFGQLRYRGTARPAPPGNYVIVASACDAAGNTGYSSTKLPPVRGSERGAAGVTLRGLEVAPSLSPLITGKVTAIPVTAPPGGYRYRLQSAAGDVVKRGSSKSATLRFRVPAAPNGLYTLSLVARRKVSGDRGRAIAPVVVSDGHARKLLVVYPSIAWQVTNPVDQTGDGFGDGFNHVATGHEERIAERQTLAGGGLPDGFAAREEPFAKFLGPGGGGADAQSTTDFAMAANPTAALAHRKAVIFVGDERWITPELGLALDKFVHQGGHVAFFTPDAFRRTVRMTAGEISGPSDRSDRDIFGEAITISRVPPAPVVAFSDSLGLLPVPTGLFTSFEQSRSLPQDAEVLTSAGRQKNHPAFVAYDLGKGVVIRVGASGWQAQLATDANVAATTHKIIAELLK